MKILNILWIFAILSTQIVSDVSRQENELEGKDPLQCEHRILQYYGFEGWTIAKEPPLEEQDGGRRFCEGMEYTCCSRDDFLKSKKLWENNVTKIKGYLTKTFRIIQKIVMMQSAFINVAQDKANGDNEYCKKVDTTFFNAPVPFDEIYSYLKTSFQSMAFVQKGFYCTLCNVENHKYMMVEQDFSRLMIAMSEKSCNDLIHYFKEFIMYKVYYLDPFILNANFLFNCIEDTDKYTYKFDYQATYQEIKHCLENDKGCGNVCREFRFGQSSELFMGDLKKYEQFLENFEYFAKGAGVDMDMQSQELYVPEYTFEDGLFFKQDQKFDNFMKKELNYSAINNHQILVFNDGIDIFGTANNSNYFLTDQTTTMEKTRIFNTNVGEGESSSILGDNNLESTGETIDQINESAEERVEEIQAAKIREEQEKFEALGPEKRPSTEELNNLDAEISKRESSRREYTEQTGLINDFDADEVDNRNNDFGEAGSIAGSKGIGVLRVGLSMIVLGLALFRQ